MIKKESKMKLSLWFLILFTGFASFGYTNNYSRKKIIILADSFNPPKCYLNKGENKGILIDIMRYIGRKMKQPLKFELYPWQRSYYKAKMGAGGVICFSMTKERLQIFDYSDIMYYETLVLVVRKGQEFRFNRLSDLRGKVIGISRGSKFGDDLEKAKKFLTLSPDNSGEQRLLKLLHKRIDVAIIGPGKMGVKAIIRGNKILSQQKNKFVILSRPLKHDPNYLGFLKTMKMQPFLKRFNWYLKQAHKSGAIRRIVNSYSH